jgi:hypothetical protein
LRLTALQWSFLHGRIVTIPQHFRSIAAYRSMDARHGAFLIRLFSQARILIQGKATKERLNEENFFCCFRRSSHLRIGKCRGYGLQIRANGAGGI